jgi:6-pyruvoyltetrahydropterin/6-carboxytetrahydropterin synthase
VSVFEVGVVAHFTAQHHLIGNFGPASEPHSHDYKLEVNARGDALSEDGTLFDITLLRGALDGLAAALDGQDLNEVSGLSELNPTVEVVARFVFEAVAPALMGHGLGSVTARVWESPEAYASYTGVLA